MPQFVWITTGSTTIFEAKDQEEAYRRVIANRLKAVGAWPKPETEDVEDVEGWFDKNDQLHEVDCEGGMGDVYAGELE